MNTSVNFNPVNESGRGGKLAHVFRDHDLKKKRVSNEKEGDDYSGGAIILQPFLTTKNTLTEGTSKLTKNLSVYKKRYEIALSKNDEKTALRNKTKIDEILALLEGVKKKRKGREASLVESSWAITKFPPNEALKYDPKILHKMKNLAIKIITDQFPMIDPRSIGVAGHIDQQSIHIHTVFDVPEGTNYTKMIADRRYSEFQQLWNKAIRDEFNDLPIETITPKDTSLKEYLPLNQYKRATTEQPLIDEINELKDTIADIAVALDNNNVDEAKKVIKNMKIDIGNATERAKSRYDERFKKRFKVNRDTFAVKPIHLSVEGEKTKNDPIKSEIEPSLTDTQPLITEEPSNSSFYEQKNPTQTEDERYNQLLAEVYSIAQNSSRQSNIDEAIKRKTEELNKYLSPTKSNDIKR